MVEKLDRYCKEVFDNIFTRETSNDLENFRFVKGSMVGGYTPNVCIANLRRGKQLVEKIEPRERNVINTKIINPVSNSKNAIFNIKPQSIKNESIGRLVVVID